MTDDIQRLINEVRATIGEFVSLTARGPFKSRNSKAVKDLLEVMEKLVGVRNSGGDSRAAAFLDWMNASKSENLRFIVGEDAYLWVPQFAMGGYLVDLVAFHAGDRVTVIKAVLDDERARTRRSIDEVKQWAAALQQHSADRGIDRPVRPMLAVMDMETMDVELVRECVLQKVGYLPLGDQAFNLKLAEFIAWAIDAIKGEKVRGQ
jgi:hypothetical protein